MTRIENTTIVLTVNDVYNAITDFIRKSGVKDAILPHRIKFELAVHGNGCVVIVTIRDEHIDLEQNGEG